MSAVEIKESAGIYTLVWEQEGVGIRLDRLMEDSKFSVTGEAGLMWSGSARAGMQQNTSTGTLS